MEDPIVSEVRKHRKEILHSYGSIRLYHEAVMKQQEKFGNRLIRDTSKSPEANTKKDNQTD